MPVNSKLKIWFDCCRPKTLPASLAPVMIGAAMAYEHGRFNWLVLALILAAAILIQIGTNLTNDYYDFIKGTDTANRLGPTRATQAGLVTPVRMKAAFIITFALATICGLYLVYKGGLPILIIGTVSLLLGVLYTAGPFPLAYTGLSDIFVLIFFGPVATAGTYYLLADDFNSTSIIAGLAPGLISTAILTVNNFRDIETDAAGGRKTLAVRFGRRFAISEYIFAMLSACLIPVLLCVIAGSHCWMVLATLAVIPSLFAIKKIRSNPNGPALNDLLAFTGKILIVYSVLFSIGWLI